MARWKNRRAALRSRRGALLHLAIPRQAGTATTIAGHISPWRGHLMPWPPAGSPAPRPPVRRGHGERSARVHGRRRPPGRCGPACHKRSTSMRSVSSVSTGRCWSKSSRPRSSRTNISPESVSAGPRPGRDARPLELVAARLRRPAAARRPLQHGPMCRNPRDPGGPRVMVRTPRRTAAGRRRPGRCPGRPHRHAGTAPPTQAPGSSPDSTWRPRGPTSGRRPPAHPRPRTH
jgi:hypothetical protein